MRQKTVKRYSHGLSRTPAYRVWVAMIHRCTNRNYFAYPRYGGRGVNVCERWLDVRAFVADMGQPPQGHSLERVDNDGPYTPENCVWATSVQQTRNRRNTRLLTHEGVTKTVQEWADHCGLKYSTLLRRVDDWGWDLGKALSQPVSQTKAQRARNEKGQYV